MNGTNGSPRETPAASQRGYDRRLVATLFQAGDTSDHRCPLVVGQDDEAVGATCEEPSYRRCSLVGICGPDAVCRPNGVDKQRLL